jgi:heme/copper-type cytochrome/quinol oxidase subunit 2
VVAQLLILRSTVRAMRASPSASARRTIEWAYAVVPVVVLAVVLVATWQASRDHTTHLEMEARANQVSAT